MIGMDTASAWATLAVERRALADLLDTLAPAQWATPSLCRGWSVQDVVAHLTVGPSASLAEVGRAMAASGFRFHVANRKLVAARAALTPSELTALLRRHAESRFHPPFHDWHAPLSDLYLHRLDCLLPLGIPVAGDLAGWCDVLSFLTSRRATIGFLPTGLPSLTYVATDCEFSHGSGPRVEGPADALALSIARRPVRLDHLAGPGADRLRAWASR